MAIIRPLNNQPTVEAKPLPAVAISSSALAGAFGNTMQTEGDAKALLLAGEQLGKASDAIERIVHAMREQAARRAPENGVARSWRGRGISATPAIAPSIRALPVD